MANKSLIESGGDGTAVPSLGVGETFIDTSTTGYSSTHVNLISRTLQPGRWRISAYSDIDISGSVYARISISTTSATMDLSTRMSTPIVASSGALSSIHTATVVNIATPTTYYLVGHTNSVPSSQAINSRLICERIG
jgi:hypothetical protein